MKTNETQTESQSPAPVMSGQELPGDWSEISPEETLRVKSCHPVSLVNDLVRHNTGLVMPRLFAQELAHRIYNFELREDDIFILSYPKTGTTWTIELVWTILNDVDIEKTKVPQMIRSPFLESFCLVNTDFLTQLGLKPDNEKLCEVFDDPIEHANKMTGRRVIKSHLPLEFLPPRLLDTCKVIYVCRNPKDTAVSYYHHNLLVPGHSFIGTFQQFLQFFKEGLHTYGSYWQHLLGGWKNRTHPNLKFLWYEDMKEDQMGVIEDLCTFLHHPLSAEQKETLVDHVKFSNMKKNPNTNPTAGVDLPPGKPDFIRKGQVGDWRNFFQEEESRLWDEWIREKITATGLEELHVFKTLK